MKITELVKTYKLLSDPNAPDWNIKFIGGIVVVLGLVGASAAIMWNLNASEAEVPGAALSEQQTPPPDEAPACSAEEIAGELARTGAASLPSGTRLPSGCAVP